MFRMKNKTLTDLDKAKVARNFWTWTVLGAALLAMTFFGVCDPSEGVRGPRGSAAWVAGEVISRAEFNRAYQSAYTRYQRQFSENFDPTAIKLATSVMNQLVDDRVLFVTAVDMGLRASDAEVIAVLAEAEVFKDEKTGGFNEENYNAFLRGNGYSESAFKEEVRRNITVQKLRRFITESTFVSSKAAELDYKLNETKMEVEYLKFDPATIPVEVNAADVTAWIGKDGSKKKVEDYYNTNKQEYDKPEKVKARHILVSFDGARNATAEAKKRKKEDAQKKAEELLTKVKAAGADFVKLAKENTDEGVGKTSGGDLGWFSKEAMVKEFSDAAFVLEKGAISGVVESPFGFHIIKVEDKQAAQKIELKDAENDIAKKLIEKEKRPELVKERSKAVLAILSEGKPVDDKLKEFKVNWASTGEVSATSRNFQGIGSSAEVRSAILAMKTAGAVHPDPVQVRNAEFVIRLKSIKEADMKGFDEEKQKELSRSVAFSRGFQLFNSLEKKFREKMKTKIEINQEFLALDNPRQEQKGG